MPPNRTRGEVLKELRAGRYLSLRALATHTGINHATLCNYEGGLKVSADSAFLLSDFYGIPFSTLYDRPVLPSGDAI